MMKALAILATLVVSVYCANPGIPNLFTSNITSMSLSGLEVIFLDGPAWATKIQRSWDTHEFFVYGDRTLRTIHSGFNSSDFYAEVDNDPLYYPLIDLHTFFVPQPFGNTKYTLGVSDFNPDDTTGAFANVQGAYLPLFSAFWSNGNASSTPKIQPNNAVNSPFQNILLYSVRVDFSNMNTTNVLNPYFGGFNVTSGQFVIVRTTFKPLGAGLGGGSYSFDPTQDVFPIYNNNFAAYSETFKPWIHEFFINGKIILIIVDPNTKAIYTLDPSTGSVTSESLKDDKTGETLYDIVSTSFDFRANQLVIGFGATGFNAGKLMQISFNNIAYPFTQFPGTISEPVVLPNNYSNPKAIVVDSGFIYIGLNGHSEILRYNVSSPPPTPPAETSATAWAYQRLPEYLHRSWDATSTFGHVYFVTYEQNSKVFRVNKEDFCPAACPYWGYCTKGQCACSPGFELHKHKTECVLLAAEKEIIYHKEYKRAHGGEIALGILWALTVIAAGAGWFLWYRGRRGAYQAV